MKALQGVIEKFVASSPGSLCIRDVIDLTTLLRDEKQLLTLLTSLANLKQTLKLANLEDTLLVNVVLLNAIDLSLDSRHDSKQQVQQDNSRE